MKTLLSHIRESILGNNWTLPLAQPQTSDKVTYEVVSDDTLKVISKSANGSIALTPDPKVKDLELHLDLKGTVSITINMDKLKSLKLSITGDAADYLYLMGKGVETIDVSEVTNINSLYIVACSKLKTFIAPQIKNNMFRIEVDKCPQLAQLDLSTIAGSKLLYIKRCPKLTDLKTPLYCGPDGRFNIRASGSIDINKIGIKKVDGYVMQENGDKWVATGYGPDASTHTKDGRIKPAFANYYQVKNGKLIKYPEHL